MASVALLHGKNLTIKVGGSVIVCAKSCDITLEAETIEIASPSSSNYKEFIAGRKSGTVSTSHLVAVQSGSPFMSYVGNTYTLSWGIGTNTYTCSAICTQSKVTATVGSLAQGSFNFQITGAITKS